jgi:protein-S-isoprenylcysteine O-methyltransferase Ste14
MTNDATTPGIAILIPPRIFMLCLIGGIAAECLLPSLAPFAAIPWPARIIAGIGIAIAGFALMGLAHRTITKAGTPINTNRPAATLLTTGVFRFSRNPIYVGFVAILAGLGAAANGPWMLLSAFFMFLYLDRFVIAREERHLRTRFGAAYDEYRNRTRRWL